MYQRYLFNCFDLLRNVQLTMPPQPDIWVTEAAGPVRHRLVGCVFKCRSCLNAVSPFISPHPVYYHLAHLVYVSLY